MNDKKYSIREEEIIKKLNEVNNILKNQNIKIQYSVYNYNGIASKLEKTDLYETDVTNAVFIRTHTCKSSNMIDNIVNSYNIKENVEIEENFNTKVSDIEKASTEELVSYFGNMNNHENIGIGKNQKYQIVYKGVNEKGQSIEIKATYGENYNYDIRTSTTQINKDGTISKVYVDKNVVIDKNNRIIENIVKQGLENRNPESYSVLEKAIGNNGNDVYKIKCLGNENFLIEAKDDAFKEVNFVNYDGTNEDYYEFNGKIEKANGRLTCRVNTENNTIIKPNFVGVNNIASANKISDEYYEKYKNYPTISFDKKTSKFIVEGEEQNINELNFHEVLENAKQNFLSETNSNYKLEIKKCQTIL